VAPSVRPGSAPGQCKRQYAILQYPMAAASGHSPGRVYTKSGPLHKDYGSYFIHLRDCCRL
jgi:hypothetical protein